MPPPPIPPSMSTILNSRSKAPSKATIFWMSALVEVMLMSNKRASLRIISRESSRIERMTLSPPGEESR